MIMSKLDMAKAYPEYYKAKNTPQIVDLEPYYYLTVEGVSAPEDPIFHSAIEQAYAVARRLRTGTVAQNGGLADFGLGFGGFKQSGVGREGGLAGLKAYFESKTILLAGAPDQVS